VKRPLIIAALMLTSVCFAQQPSEDQPAPAPAPANGPAQPIPDGKPISAVLAAWAKQNNKTLVVEPALTAMIKLDPAAKTFEQGLDLALKSQPTIKWRKVYFRAKMEQPKPARLAAMVRSLVALEATGIIIQDPTASKISSYVKSVDVPQAYAASLDKMSPAFSPSPVYVVYDSRPAWAVAGNVDLADLTADPSSIPNNAINAQTMQAISQKLMAAMMNMSPEERGKMMQGMMNMANNMDSRTRVQMMVEGMRAMQNMTPEEREGMMRRAQEDMQTMKDMGVQLPGMPGGPGGPDGPQPGN